MTGPLAPPPLLLLPPCPEEKLKLHPITESPVSSDTDTTPTFIIMKAKIPFPQYPRKPMSWNEDNNQSRKRKASVATGTTTMTMLTTNNRKKKSLKPQNSPTTNHPKATKNKTVENTPPKKCQKISPVVQRNDNTGKETTELKQNTAHLKIPVIGIIKKSPRKLDSKYIVAPMVGASELPFRILCRNFGAQLCYTPMMMASEFVRSCRYVRENFQTLSYDRPLVCHFAANSPQDFADAAKLVEPYCDAVDLNLGCPQRTAYAGHFGSYLLDENDRELVLDMVRAAVESVNIPIFCKIRLLDTYEETKKLCAQLYQAGATLIAVHARYRASFHRKGPGARDGPALLDQVRRLKNDFAMTQYSDRLLITNGNTITYQDVVKNLDQTGADGIMSAEGILDNPALFLERFGTTIMVRVKGGASYFDASHLQEPLTELKRIGRSVEDAWRKFQKEGEAALTDDERNRVKIYRDLQNRANDKAPQSKSTLVNLKDLYQAADDKTQMAGEYLTLAQRFPTPMRTAIFHTRRILKEELPKFQLMEECLSCSTIKGLMKIVQKIRWYQQHPDKFEFDTEKSKRDAEALERKRFEEGKRKRYEMRMVRKAKREGKEDLEFYLRQGSAVPTAKTVEDLKKLTEEEQLKQWKDRNHSQHCMTFHMSGKCSRDRMCAFLHVPCHTKHTFVENDEVAG
jgi:tRNA-dihydrouridine synthase 1